MVGSPHSRSKKEGGRRTMTYSVPIIKGKFLSRPNRFIALVDVNGEALTVHVKNTGRCKELLVSNCTVYLAAAEKADRKTAYDLVAVEKVRADGTVWLIHIDSQSPNAIAAEYLLRSSLFSMDAIYRREVAMGTSRFDFRIENADGQGSTAYLEVKGCTLERDGVAYFPDAPTERGVKHVKELISLAREGISAYILFIIQMKGITVLRPNDETHKAFGDVLREAKRAGVHILAVDCVVGATSNHNGAIRLSVTADTCVPVEL